MQLRGVIGVKGEPDRIRHGARIDLPPGRLYRVFRRPFAGSSLLVSPCPSPPPAPSPRRVERCSHNRQLYVCTTVFFFSLLLLPVVPFFLFFFPLSFSLSLSFALGRRGHGGRFKIPVPFRRSVIDRHETSAFTGLATFISRVVTEFAKFNNNVFLPVPFLPSARNRPTLRASRRYVAS